MAIFVNPSTGKTSLTQEEGYVNIESYTPAQAKATTAPAPTVTPTQTVAAAPAPAVTPTPTVKTTATQTQPAAVAPATAATTETYNREAITKNIQDSYNKATGAAKANEAFVNAVARATLGRNATADELGKTANTQFKVVGLSLDDVLKRFDPQGKLLGATPGMGIQPPEPTTDGAGGGVKITGEQPAEAADPVTAAIDKLIAIKQSGMAEGVDLGKRFEEMNRTSTDVEVARQAIADKQLIDAETLKTIEGRPIPMTMINRQKDGYTSDQYITDLKMTQDYNNKLILAKMAEGRFLQAQQMTKDIANDNYEIAKLQIEKARNEQAISDKEAASLEKENDFQRQMALDGYTYIANPSQLAGLKESDIYRDPVSGRIYKKPVAEDELLSISEAAALGVNYGTTVSQAAAMGINPAAIAEARKKSSGSTKKPTSYIKDTNKLIGAGLSTEDISAINANLSNGYTLDEIIAASEFTPEQEKAVRGQFMEEPAKTISGEDATTIISAAVDKDGNLDINKIPSEMRIEVLKAGREAGIFDEEDEDTRNWLEKTWDAITFWN